LNPKPASMFKVSDEFLRLNALLVRELEYFMGLRHPYGTPMVGLIKFW